MTLILFIKVDDLPEPEFHKLLDRALALGNRDRLTFNVIDRSRDEISTHVDKLIDQSRPSD